MSANAGILLALAERLEVQAAVGIARAAAAEAGQEGPSCKTCTHYKVEWYRQPCRDCSPYSDALPLWKPANA